MQPVDPEHQPEATAPRKRWSRKATIAVVVLAAAGILGGTAATIHAAHKPANPPTGYHDRRVLEPAIRTYMEARLSDPNDPAYSPGSAVTRVDCIAFTVGPDFACVAATTNNLRLSVNVTVSADGHRYTVS